MTRMMKVAKMKYMNMYFAYFPPSERSLRVPASPPQHSWTHNRMCASSCPQAVPYMKLKTSWILLVGEVCIV